MQGDEQKKKNRRPKGTGGIQRGNDPRGRPRFRGFRTINGRRVFGTWYPNLVAAENSIPHITAPDPVEAKPAVRTVKMAIDAYLKRAVIAATTRSGYETSARAHLRELHDLDLRELDIDRLYEQWDLLHERGYSRSTINQAAAVMKNTVKYAVRAKWVDSNFTKGMELPKASQAKITEFTDDERTRVLQAIVGHRYEAMWRLMMLFAVRPGEVTGLRWGRGGARLSTGVVQISGQLQRIRWRVPVGGGEATKPVGTVYKSATKSESGGRRLWPDDHTMLLLSEWKARQEEEARGRALTEHQAEQRAEQEARIATAKKMQLFDDPDIYDVAPDDLVFTLPNGDPILPRWHSDMWRAILKEAGVGHRRLYAARHTAINRQFRNGAKPLAISRAAGHKDPGFTLKRYGGDVDDIAQNMADFVH